MGRGVEDVKARLEHAAKAINSHIIRPEPVRLTDMPPDVVARSIPCLFDVVDRMRPQPKKPIIDDWLSSKARPPFSDLWAPPVEDEEELLRRMTLRLTHWDGEHVRMVAATKRPVIEWRAKFAAEYIEAQRSNSAALTPEDWERRWWEEK